MSVRKTMQGLALLALLTLSLFGLHTLRNVWEERAAAAARLCQLEREVLVQTRTNERLRRSVEELGQERESERIGREELFLFYPDEKIFITDGN